MTRTVVALLAALLFCTGLPGCGGSDPDDAQMERRREAPKAKRKPPGAMASGDLSGEGEGETDAPDPSGN